MKVAPRILKVTILIWAYAFTNTQSLYSQQEEYPEHILYYTLFSDNFKNKDYEASYEYLPWLLENAPTEFRAKTIRKRAIVTYSELAKANIDDEQFQLAMLDTVATIFETTPGQLKEAGVEINEQKWWTDYVNFIRENEDMLPNKVAEVPEILIKAFDLAPGELHPHYLKILVYALASQERKDEAIAFMDRSEPSYGDDAEVAAFYAEARNAIFKSPQERMVFLEGRLVGDSTNVQILDDLFKIYQALEESKKLEQIGAKLLDLEPTAHRYRLIAESKYDNGEYLQAITLNDKALALTDETELRRDIYYSKSLAHYQSDGLCSAWNTAKDAMKLDSTFGKGELLLGDILTRMVGGSTFDREDRAVYWLAADYYSKVLSTDPSLADWSKTKSNAILNSMPTVEDKHFELWKSGQAYSVNYGRYACVGETTTVR